MQKLETFLIRTVAVAGIVLVLGTTRGWAAEPTLARLSFWMPPERMAEFESAYQQQVVPILKQHGLVASSQHGRATIDSVFSRLFELDTPAQWNEKKEAVQKDPAWQNLLRGLGTIFETAGADDALRHRFGLYTAPAGVGRSVLAGPGSTVEVGSGMWQEAAGPGRSTPAGPGKRTMAGPGRMTPAGPGKTTPAGSGKSVLAGGGFRQGLWQSFSVPDGLPSTLVTEILQDREGYLWLGTQSGGLIRYDGVRFTTFTTEDGLAHNSVSAIWEDPRGHLWLGTGGGVSRYDGVQFTTFTTEDGLPVDQVRSIVEDRQGHLWFGTTEGVSRYDGKEFRTFTTEDGLLRNLVDSILEDRAGNLWFGGGSVLESGGGISRYDGTYFTTFTTEDGFVDDTVISICEDRQGHLWFGAQSGVIRYDGKQFTNFTTEDGLTDNQIRSIWEDRQGHLWFGTLGGGISRYDGEHFTTFTTEDGLANNWVNSIREDEQGILWIGTQGGGLSRYDGAQLTTFTTQDGLSNWMWSLLEDREGTKWFTSRGGVHRYDGKDFVTFTIEDGLASNWVWTAIEDQEGRLWFGSQHGLSRYDGKAFVTFTTEDGIAADDVWSIFEDRQGRLWFGTISGGVSRYDGREFVTFAIEDGLGGNWVTSMMEDRQENLWFGIAGLHADISRYDGTGFTTEEGLVEDNVLAMLEDRQGHLWFATQKGVSHYDGEQVTTFTTEDGLANDWVWSAMEDQKGHLWFATRGGGVSRYDGRVFQTLSRKDGLVNDEVREFHQDARGDIWIATSGGITRYRPSSIPPAIHLEAVADRRYGSVQELRLPSSQAFLTFEFQGRSMTTPPDGMVYIYRLQGHDDEWRTTRTTEVEYTDLPRGEYVFQVKAVDRDLNYSEPATVVLQVHLPYAQVGWISALSVAVLLILWQSGRVVRRDRRLQESNQALSEANKELFGLNQELQLANQQIQQANRHKSDFLARMSHDLRTPMNAIIGYTRILLRKLSGGIDERQYHNLENVQTSADHLLILINDILDLSKIEAGRMDIQPEQVDLKHLVAECVTSICSLVKPGVQLDQHVEDVAPVRTDLDRLRRILMNLLSNAVKFTEQGHITVSLRAAGEWTELAVADTGVGISSEELPHIFDEFHQVDGPGGGAQEGTGLGLAIAQKSGALLGGTLSVESEVGKGTTFTLRLKDYEP